MGGVIKICDVRAHVFMCVWWCPLQNVLDDRLRHTNLGVVLGAVRLFLHLTDDMPNLHKDVHERIKSEFDTLLLLGLPWNPSLKWGHLHSRDTFGCPKFPFCVHYIPWNQDTSLIKTLSSVSQFPCCIYSNKHSHGGARQVAIPGQRLFRAS